MKNVGLCAAALGLILLCPSLWAAKSEPMDVDVDIQKTLIKEKTKDGQRNIAHKQTDNTKSGGVGGGSSSCGNIDIGNSAPSKGAGQFAKPTTVIVTGPVINANNNCK